MILILCQFVIRVVSPLFSLCILPTDSTIDPSLQEKQRQLKRARLQDSLSERLVNRPGPLELVERNILPIDPQIDTAVRGQKITTSLIHGGF